MKRQLSISYTPKAILVFRRYEVAMMLVCSRHHYDGVFVEASMEIRSNGRPGFLAGMRNCMRNARVNYPHELTFREIDTMAKCLEQAHMHYTKLRDIARITVLARYLRAALTNINDSALPDKKINLDL